MSGKSKTALSVVMGAGAPIALNAEGHPPEWIMLLPAGNSGVIATVDDRGPFRVRDAVKLASVSMPDGMRLPIDENHATDLAAPEGRPSPARGWAVELQAREDGIYGRVEWTESGKALLADRSYRFISPVITHDKAGNVTGLLRASLTNRPNLRGMTALNSEESNMDLLAKLRELLGLAADADEAAVIAKITAMAKDTVSTNAALSPIAKAVGLKDDAGAPAILTAVTTLKDGTALQSIAKAAGLKDDADVTAITAAVKQLAAGTGPTVVALQAEVKELGEKLSTALNSTAKDKAIAYIDGEIKKGRVGVKALRDHYVSMHMEDPARVEKEIGALPLLGPSGATIDPPPHAKDGKVALNSAQKDAAKLLGISEADYQKTLTDEQSAV